MTARETSPTPEVHGDLAGVQTRHRPGARLVRRRRQRLRLVLPTSSSPATTPSSARRTPACGAPTSSGMWFYRLSLAKVKWHSLTGEPLTGKEAAAVELINESVPFENLEARVKEIADKLAEDPAVPTAGAEAHRQPGLREHGPGLDPDARRHPRRVDAQHPRCARRSSKPLASQGVRAADRAARRPVGRLQPGAAGDAGPTRRTSSSPRDRPRRSSSASRSAMPRSVSLRCVHVVVPTNSPRMRSRSSDSVMPRTRAALPMAPGHSCHGSTRTSAVTDVMVRVDVSTEPATVYSCTIVSTPSPSTCESRKWASKSADAASTGCRSSRRNRRIPCARSGSTACSPTSPSRSAAGPPDRAPTEWCRCAGRSRRARPRGRTRRRCPPCCRPCPQAVSPRRPG